MAEITESRNVAVDGIIVSLQNIRRLSSIVLDHYDSIKGDDKYARIEFEATCFDESHFSSSDIEIFSNESVLASKRVSNISVSFSSYKTNSTIKIKLVHGGRGYNNYISVTGIDSAWVNGILNKLEEEVKAFTPQNRFLSNYKKHLNFLFALSIGSLYFYFLDLIPVDPIEAKPPEWLLQLAAAMQSSIFFAYVLKYIFYFMVGIWPAFSLMEKLESLWPSVEFQIGPEHTFIEKKRRFWIASTFVIGVVPILISIIYDLFKAFVLNAS